MAGFIVAASLPTFSDDLYGYIRANYLVRQFAPDVAFWLADDVGRNGGLGAARYR